MSIMISYACIDGLLVFAFACSFFLFGYIVFEFTRGLFYKKRFFLILNIFSVFLVLFISLFFSGGGMDAVLFFCFMISYLVFVVNNNV